MSTAVSSSQASAPPEWWQNAHEYLQTVSDTPSWIVMCERWLTHERIMGYPDGDVPNRLPTKYRPPEIKWWIGRGRPYEKIPPITDVKRYGVEWKAWWTALQPEWRGSSLGQVVPADEDIEWGSLRRGGCNAVFLVILSLGWWWSLLPADSRDREEVEELMRDVSWVLSAMHNLIRVKRSGEDISSVSKRSRQ
ncbi:hypothetical protein BC629DRAFT_1294269 [Irpex lacteus]|nr:hypothetical protein BC629DRAFT_1294269 [Irpex lacteus]